MKDLIKRYLKLKIECKTSERKQLKRIDDVTKQLYEIVADLKLLVDEYKDESYKTKFHNEHKKRKELEKESKEIIEEFTNAIKELEKENRKLKKENK